VNAAVTCSVPRGNAAAGEVGCWRRVGPTPRSTDGRMLLHLAAAMPQPNTRCHHLPLAPCPLLDDTGAKGVDCAPFTMMTEGVACGLIVVACLVAVLFALYQVSDGASQELGRCAVPSFDSLARAAGATGPHAVASRATYRGTRSTVHFGGEGQGAGSLARGHQWIHRATARRLAH